MKKVVYSLLVVVLLVSLLLGCAPAAPAGPIVLKAVAWLGLGRALSANAEQVYIPMIEERSNGELKIDLIGGPEVIPKTEQADQCAKGAIDFVFGVVREYGVIVPACHGYGSMTMLPWEEREKGVFDWWVKQHKKANLMYLGHWSTGDEYYFIIYLKEPISTLDDFKGLRIDGIDVYDTFLQELGAVPMSVGGSEFYTALERGLMDGFVWSNAGTFPGWEELAKAPIDETIGYCHTFSLIMNLDKWNSLPKHLQDLLMEVTAEYEHIAGDYYNGLVAQTRSIWEAAGGQYIKLSPAEGEWYREEARKQRWAFSASLMGPELAAEMEKEVLLK